jgi:hypothetical protein
VHATIARDPDVPEMTDEQGAQLHAFHWAIPELGFDAHAILDAATEVLRDG